MPRLGLAVTAASLLLGGCAGGFDLGRLDTDRSILTGSIAGQTGQKPDTRVSDEAAIHAAIAAWPVEGEAARTVPWVNANTGSSGAITRLSESNADGKTCRAFTVTRDSFGGSSRYAGKACIAPAGSWIVTEMAPG